MLTQMRLMFRQAVAVIAEAISPPAKNLRKRRSMSKFSLRDVDFLARFDDDEFAIKQRCETKNLNKIKNSKRFFVIGGERRRRAAPLWTR